jgi:hypothetical protein
MIQHSSTTAMTMKLCPAQQKGFDHLLRLLTLFPVVGISGDTGAGKTTVLREAHRRVGGEWLSIKEVVHALRAHHPLAIEETLEQLIEAAFQQAEHIFVDDLSILVDVSRGACGGAYPRAGFLSAALESVTARAEAAKRKLIFTCTYALHELHKKGFATSIVPFEPSDYEFFCTEYLASESVDLPVIETTGQFGTVRQ